MALDPRDFFARTQEDKAAGVDPRDFFARSQEDKAAATGAQSVTVGLVTENESLFSITPVPGGVSQSVGQVTENETLFAVTVTGGISQSVGLVTENETLFAVTPVPGVVSQAVGLVTENESLFAATLPAPPAVSIARWLLDEASSGQGPSTIVDDTGNGNDLDSIQYDGSNLNWTSIAAGNGLDFSANDHAAIAELDDIVNNGNIGSELDAANEFSFIVRADLVAAGGSGNRIFFVGADGGNGDIALVVQTGSPGSVQVRMNDDAGSNEADYNTTFPAGLHTWGVTVDTTETSTADRVKLYKDGILQTVTSTNFSLNENLEDINTATHNVNIGNRGDLGRGAECKVYYVELFKGKLTPAEHTAAHDALVINNDADWFAPRISVGQVTENETLFGPTVVPGGVSQAVGLLTENESLLAVTPATTIAVSVGLLTENESLFPVGVSGGEIAQETIPAPFGGNQDNTLSVNCGINANRFLAVHIAWWDSSNEAPDEVTYDGEAMTVIDGLADPDDNASVWYGLVNPSPGFNDLVVNFDVEPNEGPVIAAHPLYNVVQTSVAAAVRDSGTNDQNGGTYSVVLSGIQPSDFTLAGVYNFDSTLQVSWSTLTEDTDANFTGSSDTNEGSTASDLGVSTCTATVSNESVMTAFALINVAEGISQAVGQITENESLFSPAAILDQSIVVGLVTENETLFAVTPVPGGISQAVGLVTENESLFATTPVPGGVSQAVGLLTENESLFVTTPVPGGISQVVGLLTENENLFSPAIVQATIIAVGQVTENESLFATTPIPGGISQAVGLVTENESLFSPAVIQGAIIAVGLVTENESLFSPTIIFDQLIAVGLVTENESLFSAAPVPGGISQAVGLVTENESLFSPAVVTAILITVGLITENESLFVASPVPGGISQGVGLVTENESLFSTVPANVISISVGQALENELLFATTPVPGGISQGVGLLTENESLFAVTFVVPGLGGIFNAIGFLPTGGTVTIGLINVETDAIIPLDDNSCIESNTLPGLYLWDSTKLTTQPVTDIQYGWRMTDGTNFDGGDIVFNETTVLKIVEIWRRLALDPNNPLTNKADGSIEATGIDIVGDGTQTGPDVIQTRS